MVLVCDMPRGVVSCSILSGEMGIKLIKSPHGGPELEQRILLRCHSPSQWNEASKA
jgi:hypothetical protein